MCYLVKVFLFFQGEGSKERGIKEKKEKEKRKISKSKAAARSSGAGGCCLHRTHVQLPKAEAVPKNLVTIRALPKSVPDVRPGPEGEGAFRERQREGWGCWSGARKAQPGRKGPLGDRISGSADELGTPPATPGTERRRSHLRARGSERKLKDHLKWSGTRQVQMTIFISEKGALGYIEFF